MNVREAAIRAAVDMKRVLDLQDIEIHRTMTGHWHPADAVCSRACPVGDPETRRAFERVLMQEA